VTNFHIPSDIYLNYVRNIKCESLTILLGSWYVECINIFFPDYSASLACTNCPGSRHSWFQGYNNNNNQAKFLTMKMKRLNNQDQHRIGMRHIEKNYIYFTITRCWKLLSHDLVLACFTHQLIQFCFFLFIGSRNLLRGNWAWTTHVGSRLDYLKNCSFLCVCFLKTCCHSSLKVNSGSKKNLIKVKRPFFSNAQILL